MTFQAIVEWVVHGLEAMGIAVVSVGGSAAMINFARRAMAGDAFEAESSVLRERLARATLLGLEFLVAADIIRTVAVEPTFRGVGVLAVIVAVRTFLSFTLDVELEGRWPWQDRQRRDRHERGASRDRIWTSSVIVPGGQIGPRVRKARGWRRHVRLGRQPDTGADSVVP